jgi:DnaK suppressor protein
MSKTTGAKAKTSAKKPAKAATAAKGKAVSKTKATKSNITPAATKGTAKAKAATATGKSAQRGHGAASTATAKAAAPKKLEGTKKKMSSRVKIADIVLPAGYKPSEDEPFMNDMHKAYFRKRLLEWKDEILRQTRETLAILHEDSTQHADLADRATSETDRATELRTRDRQRKLIAKIDAALGRIEDGSYGYCEDTGEPIGLKRLDARPIATLSVEAQERHERRERVYREE